MVIDWLIKEKYYISYTIEKNGRIAEAITYLSLNSVWKLYDLLLLLTLD